MDANVKSVKENMMTAVRTCIHKYATFDGRAARSEFWWFTLAVVIGNVIFSIIAGIPGLGLISLVYSLAILLPSTAVGVRRLHDLDKTGWLYLVVLVPLLGALYLIYLFIQEGTKGENKYGPDPL